MRSACDIECVLCVAVVARPETSPARELDVVRETILCPSGSERAGAGCAVFPPTSRYQYRRSASVTWANLEITFTRAGDLPKDQTNSNFSLKIFRYWYARAFNTEERRILHRTLPDGGTRLPFARPFVNLVNRRNGWDTPTLVSGGRAQSFLGNDVLFRYRCRWRWWRGDGRSRRADHPGAVERGAEEQSGARTGTLAASRDVCVRLYVVSQCLCGRCGLVALGDRSLASSASSDYFRFGTRWCSGPGWKMTRGQGMCPIRIPIRVLSRKSCTC